MMECDRVEVGQQINSNIINPVVISTDSGGPLETTIPVTPGKIYAISSAMHGINLTQDATALLNVYQPATAGGEPICVTVVKAASGVITVNRGTALTSLVVVQL